MLMVAQKFNDALLKAVDFAFDLLGKSCHHALYFHLEKTFRVSREEIPNKVEEFDNAIKLIFKDGAVYLEKIILEKLCEDLGVKFEGKSGFSFVDAVSKVKGRVSEKESLLRVSDFSERVVVTKRKRGIMET
jgi:hypothetical protein